MIFKSCRKGEIIRSWAGSGRLSLVWNLEIAVVAGQIENATKSNGVVNYRLCCIRECDRF